MRRFLEVSFAIGIIIAVAAVVWIRLSEDRTEAKEPVPVGAASSTMSLPAMYTVQTDDTCRGIAALYTGSEDSWRQLFAANGDPISQEAARRGVAAEECPLQAGWVLTVPALWIPGGAVTETQEVLVKDGWTHWKSTVVFGVIGGILFGVALARAAPPLWRCYRSRRTDPLRRPLD
jgi:hypothetical protein